MATNVQEIVTELLLQREVITNREVARLAGLTRQAVHRHLWAMVEGGSLTLEGEGRGARYRKAGPAVRRVRFDVEGFREKDAWATLLHRYGALQELSAAASEVAQYALLAGMRNAADHSGAPGFEVALS